MARKKKGKKKLPVLDLSASQSERRGASRKLGGITIWSASDDSLSGGIEFLNREIQQAASEHLCLSKNVLRKLVRTRIAPRELEDKVFSAVLGSVLRMGVMDCFVCVSKNDRPFRVLVHASKLSAFYEAVAMAVRYLESQGAVAVADFEAELFGARKYNSWSASSHVLSHVAYRGLAAADDAGNFVLIERLT